MLSLIQQITTLSQMRIPFFLQSKNDRYKGSQTYFQEIRKEIDEAQAENREHNTVYLEDELGDVFWDYMMLLNALASEGKITNVEKVFERCWKKFSGRISESGENRSDWNEVKAQQKAELKVEHEKKYG
jgi:NTP pyrophosphatase (non-canonical NTP hydrolase)